MILIKILQARRVYELCQEFLIEIQILRLNICSASMVILVI